ncbi:peroxidase-like [Choristoneura fumiferana]|uniref:peroxidase-like n=1 Tax=Choristoneura fumiferana TaxID=7141 RepID=UPI003D15C4A3
MNKNFEKINRGTFFQHAGKIDDIQDPEISEKFYGDLQRAADLPALDIQRGRDLGLRGYNDYRHICGMKPAKKFEDFADVMDYEKIESLKKLYVEIEDIDLLAGIMSENFIRGTFAGPTLFCIMTKQLQLFRFADRFWFERGDQFHSLTLPQLHEIRKTNIARLACDNADAIKAIQPRAFENVGPNNKHVPCTHIPGLDITKWKDISCRNDKYYHSDHDEQRDSYRNNYENMSPMNNHNQNDGKNNRFVSNDGKIGAKGHWFVNQYGKDDVDEYWPVQSNRKNKENKHWTMGEDDGQYRPQKYNFMNKEIHNKYRPASVLKEEDGKYDDETDWPYGRSSKKQSQWASMEGANIRHNTYAYNGQPFTSVSHQYSHSYSSDFW